MIFDLHCVRMDRHSQCIECDARLIRLIEEHLKGDCDISLTSGTCYSYCDDG